MLQKKIFLLREENFSVNDRKPPGADVYLDSNHGPVWGNRTSSRLPSRVAATGSVKTFAGTHGNGRDVPFTDIRRGGTTPCRSLFVSLLFVGSRPVMAIVTTG